MVLLQQELWLRCAKLTLSLSLRFNGHFPRVPVLACVCWSTTRWWWQLELQYWNRSCQNLISCIINTLSLSLAAIFPGEPGLAGFVEAKDDGGAGDNWSYTSCKAPVKSSPPTNQHPVFLQAGWPSCRPTNNVKALNGKNHIPWTCLPQAHLGVFQLCLWPLIAPGYLGEGLSCLSSALWCQYPRRAKLQSPETWHPAFLQAGSLFCCPTESEVWREKVLHDTDLLTPNLCTKSYSSSNASMDGGWNNLCHRVWILLRLYM